MPAATGIRSVLAQNQKRLAHIQNHAVYTLILYVYRTTFMMYQFGKASAASFLIFLMILLFTVVNNRLLTKAEQ